MFALRWHRPVSHSAVLVPAALLCLGLMGWSRRDGGAGGGEVALRFIHEGRTRTATLFVPTATPPAAGWPLVLLLHGAGGGGAQMLHNDGWVEVAQREHFVVVAPDGTPGDESRPARFVGNPRTWNSGVGGGLATTATLRPALDSPTRWAAMNRITSGPHIVRDDSITVRQWGPVPSGVVVVSEIVKGHGHGWLSPGADRLPERLIGPRRAALNATETMWAFFEAHARR